MNYYNDTSCFPASTSQRSSNFEFLFANTASIRMEYTWTPRRSRSFEVGLLQPPSMKFDSLSVCVNFYQHVVKGLQAVAPPLTTMFKADFEWGWTSVHQAAFDKMKQAMISATHLSAIDPRQPYHLYTDASKDCVGATLAQRCAHGKYRGHLRPIAFM